MRKYTNKISGSLDKFKITICDASGQVIKVSECLAPDLKTARAKAELKANQIADADIYQVETI